MQHSEAYNFVASRRRCFRAFFLLLLLYVFFPHAGRSFILPTNVSPTSQVTSSEKHLPAAEPNVAIQAFSLPLYFKGFKRWSGPKSPKADVGEPLAAEGHKFTRLASDFRRHREFPGVFPNNGLPPSLSAADKQEPATVRDAGYRIFELVNKTATANWSIDTQYAITNKHFLPTNFTFLAAHADTCLAKINGTSAVKGLILTPSAGSNSSKRDQLRKRFPPGSPALRRFFFVGVPVLNADAQTRCENSLEGCKPDEKLFAQLQAENAEHQDLIISLTLDTYQSITIKWLSILHWAVTYCPQAKVLFKMDDDVLPNMPFLVKLIDRFSKEAEALSSQPPSTTTSNQKMRHTIQAQTGPAPSRGKIAAWLPRDSSGAVLNKWMGAVWPFAKVFRPNFKNSLFVDEYPNGRYPYYANGPSYIISMDIVRQMLQMAKRVPYIPIDDAYTGILGHLLGLKVQDHHNIMRHRCGPAAVMAYDGKKETVLRTWEKCYRTEHLPQPPLSIQ